MNNTKWTRANELLKEKKFSDALKAYTDALHELPGNPDLLHDRGVCYFHLGKKDLALIDMNKAVELQPDYSYRYASRAYIRSACKDVEGAISDYEKALKLDPKDAISMNNLGLLEEQLGYMSKAKDRFKKADELNEILSERGIAPENEIEPPVIEEQKEEKKIDSPSSNPSLSSEMMKTLKDKDQRKSFFKFILNGFKIKK